MSNKTELAEKMVREAYRTGGSLNDLVPMFGTTLINKMCDKAEAQGWEGTPGHPPSAVVLHAADKIAAKLASRNVVVSRGDMRIVEVGTFTVGEAGIKVCDPSDEETEVYQAFPGKWVGFVALRNLPWHGDGKPHERTCMLVAAHEYHAPKVRGLFAGQLIGSASSLSPIDRMVESGQMAVFSAEADFGDELYGECCAQNELGGIVRGVGVVSDTAQGDNLYPGHVWKDCDGSVVAVSMTFWGLRQKA